MYINLSGEVCVDGTVCLNPLDGEDAYMAICCDVDCVVGSSSNVKFTKAGANNEG